MTVTELYNEFLVRKDKIASLSGKGYEDWEVSSFLTRAQLRLVKQYAQAYEVNEYARKALSKLVVGPVALDSQTSTTLGLPTDMDGEDAALTLPQLLEPTNKLFKLPADVMQVVWENIVVGANTYNVIPVTHDEYDKIKLNRFRNANSRKALRLDTGGFEVVVEGEANVIAPTDRLFHEIKCIDFDKEVEQTITYKIRYIKVPNNIVYSQVPSEQVSSYLSSFVHDKLVDEAVLLALENSEDARTPTYAQLNQANK